VTDELALHLGHVGERVPTLVVREDQDDVRLLSGSRRPGQREGRKTDDEDA
jgi:hypothetical protein